MHDTTTGLTEDQRAMAMAQRAIQRFLTFDNRVEPPSPHAPYRVQIDYETDRLALTEDLAAANEALCELLPPMSEDLRVLSD